MAYKRRSPQPIVEGGTNASTFTQSNGIVAYNGTSLVNYTGPQLDSSGRMTNASQPAFLAYNSSIRSDVTGDGTNYTLIFDTEVFDQGGVFNGTSTFTAPVTGRYYLSCTVLAQEATSAMQATLQIVTSNRNYTFGNYANAQTGNFPMHFATLVDMDAADTATCVVNFAGGAKVVDIYGAVGDLRTIFSGYLVC